MTEISTRVNAPSSVASGQPDSPLQLSREEMRELGYKVVDTIVEHFEELPNKPVTRKAGRLKLENRLREPIPEKGSDIQEVLGRLQRDVFGNMMHVDHPRFFAFIPSPSNFVSAMADALASGFNVFSGSWLEGSGPTQVELVTVDWLRQLCAMPETTSGLFVSGGSMANLTALAVAREARLGNQVSDAVIYCSDQTHSSIDKALRLLGFGPHQIRKIPSDDGFRLPMPELRREVLADRAAGKVPFCVVANAGTTNTGAVDPLAELAKFCQANGLWLHADAAYGGAAALHEKGRELLDGIEKVDSLTLDPHKWLFQPHEIGCVLIREGWRLKDTFRSVPDYVRDADRAEEEVNFFDHGIQMTRGFRALKLWMSLQVFGLEAFREAVERGISLAELVEDVLCELPRWEIVTPAQIGMLTFRYAPEGWLPAEVDALNRKLVEETIEDGFAMVSSTVLEGRTVLRMCTNNPSTTDADIRETIQMLTHLAEKLNFHAMDNGAATAAASQPANTRRSSR